VGCAGGSRTWGKERGFQRKVFGENEVVKRGGNFYG